MEISELKNESENKIDPKFWYTNWTMEKPIGVICLKPGKNDEFRSWIFISMCLLLY